MKKQLIKETLFDILSNILAIVLIIGILSFITLICWNHLATIFALYKLHFIDIFCIFIIIYCICVAINLGIREEL